MLWKYTRRSYTHQPADITATLFEQDESLRANQNETIQSVQKHLLPVSLVLRQSANAAVVSKRGQLARNCSSSGGLRRFDQFLVRQKLHAVQTGLNFARRR